MAGKLTILCHALNVDGATMVVKRVVESPNFVRHYRTIEIISPIDGPARLSFEKLGIRVKILPYFSNRKSKDSGRSSFRRLLGLLALVLTLLWSDRVWVNTIDHPSLLFLILNVLRKRGLFYFHEGLDSPFSGKFATLRKGALIRSACSSKRMALAFPSKSSCSAGARILGVDPIYLPYGINVENLKAGTDRFSDDVVKFVSIGSVCERKGQSFLGPVFKEVSLLVARDPQRYRDFSITFVGVDYLKDYKFMERILDYIPTSKVTFLRQIDNNALRSSLEDYHCLLSPSFNEALPMNVLEQMACGGLVIGSLCEGQDELLVDGKTGLSFGVGDYSSFVKRILFVLDRSNLESLRSIAEHGKRMIEGDYSLERFVSRVNQALTGSQLS